jgi:MFS family permease
MVTGFHVGDKSQASFYCGILISAFSLAESLTSIWWGSLSDKIGRKPVLIIGCFGTLTSLLVVGFADSFAVALFGRILGGLLNGNIGTIPQSVLAISSNYNQV